MMTDSTQMSEQERRALAQASAGGDVEPGAREIPPTTIRQMLSVRIEPQLIRELRQVARARGVTVSDLLRQAASDLVEAQGRQTPAVTLRLYMGKSGPSTASAMNMHYEGAPPSAASSTG